jgi:hypothetical protein
MRRWQWWKAEAMLVNRWEYIHKQSEEFHPKQTCQELRSWTIRTLSIQESSCGDVELLFQLNNVKGDDSSEVQGRGIARWFSSTSRNMIIATTPIGPGSENETKIGRKIEVTVQYYYGWVCTFIRRILLAPEVCAWQLWLLKVLRSGDVDMTRVLCGRHSWRGKRPWDDIYSEVLIEVHDEVMFQLGDHCWEWKSTRIETWHGWMWLGFEVSNLDSNILLHPFSW